MFTRYWRTYPWFLQLFLFMMMMFTFASFGVVVTQYLLPGITGVSTKEIIDIGATSSAAVRRAAIFAQSISAVFVFIIPCLIFAYFTHPNPAKYLGIRLPGKPVHWLLAAGIILGFLPLSIFLESLLQQHVDLGKAVKDLQLKNDATFAAYLKMQTPGDFIGAFLAMAVIPPIGEELFFRSVIFRFVYNRPSTVPNLPGRPKPVMSVRAQNKRMVLPILFTAIIFCLMHPNPYGRIFIFASGVLLALIYWLTGSLLCSIWAHALFNGTQVILAFINRNALSSSAPQASEGIPVWLAITGLVILVASLYGLVKLKTPLPPDWSADYTPEELAATKEKEQ